MSWFDAASFTSYAKTALASAQKSIDRALDIDEEADKKTDVKHDKGGGTDSIASSTQKKTSGLKLQTSKPQSKSNSSSQKDSHKSETSVEGGRDFWSSFLGSSSPSSTSSSSSSSSSSSAKKKTSTSPKQNDLKTEHKKTDNQGGMLEKRRKKLENRTNDFNIVTKNRNEKMVFNEEDGGEKSKKEIPSTVETENSCNSKSNHGNETEQSSLDSSEQQPLDESLITEESSTSCDGKTKEEKDKKAFPTTEQQKTFSEENILGTEWEKQNLGNKRKSQNSDNTNSEDQKGGTSNSQKLIIEIKDQDAEDRSKLNNDENKGSLTLTTRQSEYTYDSVGQESKNNDTVSKNIEPLIHATPMATSTPYAGKDRVLDRFKGKDNHDISCVEEGLYLSRKTNDAEKILGKQGDKGEEQGDFVRKEPVEDECVGEEVVTGSVYTAEETLPDKDENLDGRSNDGVIGTEGSASKPPNLPEPTGSSSATEEGDNEEYNLKATGEIADIHNLTDNKEEETTLPKESLEHLTETVEAKEKQIKDQDSAQTQSLLKEVSSLKELVNARESKMVALSKENIDLQEANAILRSQLEQLESVHKEEDEEFEAMKEEFTTRIAAGENRFHEVAQERDELKRELEETTKHLTAVNERQKEELTTLISEKDEQIAQLLTEGEKLSKQELQSNTIIKKLRAKEKENDALIKKQTKKLEEYENEVKRLTEILTSRDDSHSKQEDAIIKLNTYVKKQEEQLSKQASELEDANEKVRSMQVALDNAYKEMTSLQKQAASTDSSIQEAVLSAEMKAKEDLRIALEKTRREYGQDSELMALQISDLQASLSRAEKQGTRREESLRQEIKDLQQRIQEAEDRNQELAASVSHATRPLLRQIENLQTTHSGQASTWEMVEKNLTERLSEAQSQLLAAQEKERLAKQNASELSSRITRIESQVNSYRTERARLETELELERNKSGSLEDSCSREAAKSDAMLNKYKKMIEEANLDKAHLEQQLAVEKSRLETELKKVKTALESKEKLLSRQSSVSSIPSPSAFSEPSQDDEVTQQKTHARKTSSGSSVVDGIARGFLGGTTELVERLQAQVRQKDGEIQLLQDEVTSLRQARDSVMEELTNTSRKLDGLETSQEQFTNLKSKYDELQQRYNAVLQMYGEKEEEAEELRMDLQDVKSMYKQQLEQLFGSGR